ncbi:MAG: hypothetical protein AAF615_01870 [Pseudomonadota bacterium]
MSADTANAKAAANDREPKDKLILSIHIPKTAGTRFGEVLKSHYGDAFANYYGADDQRTHPAVKVRAKDLSAAHLNELALSGVKVLHGHMTGRALVRAGCEPKQIHCFLREPIEHTISRYHFSKVNPGTHPELRKRFDDGLNMEDFAALPKSRNFQSGYIYPLKLHEIGFVGITEFFSQMLPLIDLPDIAAKANVNEAKPHVDIDTRERLIPHLSSDIALYSSALELAIRRLGLRDTRRRTRYKRSVSDLARRFGAPG